jgi:hypothetical protein
MLTDEQLAEIRRAVESDPQGWEGDLLAEVDRLRAEAQDAVAPDRGGYDGTERLCRALYGRPPQPRDYLGGSASHMLHDAADLIVRLTRPDRDEEPTLAQIRFSLVAAQQRSPGSPRHHWRRRYEEDVAYLLNALACAHNIIADLLLESEARRAGAAEERRRLREAIRRNTERDGLGDHWSLADLDELLATLSPLPDPLPPEAARAEADRLREALRPFADAWQAVDDNTHFLVLNEDLRRAREALGK